MSHRTIAVRGGPQWSVLLLAVLASISVSALCIGANWLFYSDYANQRGIREAEKIKLLVFCAELRERRKSEPRSLEIARQLQRCTTNKNYVGK